MQFSGCGNSVTKASKQDADGKWWIEWAIWDEHSGEVVLEVMLLLWASARETQRRSPQIPDKG